MLEKKELDTGLRRYDENGVMPLKNGIQKIKVSTNSNKRSPVAAIIINLWSN
jgi:hypothetical protein